MATPVSSSRSTSAQTHRAISSASGARKSEQGSRAKSAVQPLHRDNFVRTVGGASAAAELSAVAHSAQATAPRPRLPLTGGLSKGIRSPGATGDSGDSGAVGTATSGPVEGSSSATAAGLQPGETIKNQKLYDYLQANPDVKTVQDFINKTYPVGQFEKLCDEFGLSQTELAKYRSANLRDWAVIPAPPSGSAPHTAAEANENFLTQYNTEFNPYYDKDGVSTNCGPTSLAMTLRIAGKMPPGLNTEQQIDYARALMYPDLEEGAYKVVQDANGKDVRLLDQDRWLTSIDNETNSIVRGATEAGIDATHETGWDKFDEALNSGQTVVVEGNISGSWRNVFANHPEAPGDYAGGGDGHFIAVLGKTNDGKYIVADPMYSGGTVEMTRDELAVFFAKQNGDPSFVAMPAAEGNSGVETPPPAEPRYTPPPWQHVYYA